MWELRLTISLQTAGKVDPQMPRGHPEGERPGEYG
jgi:hypothetical protein